MQLTGTYTEDRLTSSPVTEGGGPRPTTPTVGPHQLPSTNVGAAGFDGPAHMGVRVVDVDDLDERSGLLP